MADTLSEQEIFDSAEAPEEVTAPEGEQPAGEQPRDEQGRFAQKEEQPVASDPPQPQETQPAAPEEPKPETAQGVPPGLLEERRRRQEAEQRASALEKQFAEMQGRMTAHEAFLRAQQRPQEQQPQPQSPDLFENPQGFVQHQMQPVAQALQQQREGFSRLMAIDKHGEEAVNAAYSELENMVRTNPSAAQADYIRVMNSPHPFGELVKWHKSRQTMQQVGDDPNAWFEKTLEQKLADPAFQQVLAGKLGPAKGTNPANRQAPLVSIPSINRAPGSASTPADSVPGSEEELFNAAPRRMGRRD